MVLLFITRRKWWWKEYNREKLFGILIMKSSCVLGWYSCGARHNIPRFHQKRSRETCNEQRPDAFSSSAFFFTAGKPPEQNSLMFTLPLVFSMPIEGYNQWWKSLYSAKNAVEAAAAAALAKTRLVSCAHERNAVVAPGNHWGAGIDFALCLVGVHNRRSRLPYSG